MGDKTGVLVHCLKTEGPTALPEETRVVCAIEVEAELGKDIIPVSEKSACLLVSCNTGYEGFATLAGAINPVSNTKPASFKGSTV
jgi:hypothetical protein